MPAAAATLAETINLLARFAAAAVVTRSPHSPWASLLRAQAAEQAGQTEAADKEYQRAVSAPEPPPEVFIRYGQFLCRNDRLDEGLANYEQGLRADPARADVAGLIGEVHALRNRPEQAVPHLRKALQANPREARIRLYLAQALNRTGRAAEAIQVLEAAPEDQDGRIHYLLGRTYEQQGQPGKAREAMDIFRQRRGAATR
jgi:predicted Zn-dependent protease